MLNEAQKNQITEQHQQLLHERLTHRLMQKKFVKLAKQINTEHAPKGIAKEMQTVLNVYADMFHCTTGKAYSLLTDGGKDVSTISC